MNRRVAALLWAMTMPAAAPAAGAQACASGQVATHEAFLHGRFETRMQSVAGGGVVSAFFLYNLDLGCNWPAQNNEIDIEMTGNRADSVQFTTHYPGPWSVTEIVPLAFDPHAAAHDYAIEWAPGVVRWFVDGTLAYVQDGSYVQGLQYPMRLMMNLWAADAPGWTGVWDPSVMPAQARYGYVRYYAYTPGTGHAGTGNDFTLAWSDDFDVLDTQRWAVSQFGGFGGNFCTFIEPNVAVTDGELRLNLSAPPPVTSSLVRFRVDATALDVQSGDTIYLNGTFNGWCGTCAPMSDGDGDGVWERTVLLEAGVHEYLFTRNGWADIGHAPLGSACDARPCDEWANYGVTVPYGGAPVDTPVHCWASCADCGAPDADGDGFDDGEDNCTVVSNPAQTDSDGDAIGNVCDPDINALPAGNDCVVNALDLGVLKAAFFSTPGAANWNPDADLSGAPDGAPDGQVNVADLARFKAYFFGPPGPSAAGCH